MSYSGMVRAALVVTCLSPPRYFGAFNDAILNNFYDSFHKYLTESVVQLLAEKGFLVQPSASDAGRSLADAPPALTFLMTTYLHMLQDPRIVTLLHTYCPRSSIKSWPTDIPPTGILTLLFDDTTEVRAWAQKQCALCEVAPIPMENFLAAHISVLKSVADSIASSRPLSDCFGNEYKLPWLQDHSAIWTSFTTLLRFVPIELFRSSRSFDLDVRHIIVGHLHDTEKRQLFRYLQALHALTYSYILSCPYLLANRFHRRLEELHHCSEADGSRRLARRGP